MLLRFSAMAAPRGRTPSAQLERTIAWSDAPYDGGASPASGGRDDARYSSSMLRVRPPPKRRPRPLAPYWVAAAPPATKMSSSKRSSANARSGTCAACHAPPLPPHSGTNQLSRFHVPARRALTHACASAGHAPLAGSPVQPAAADDDESAKLKLSSAGADPLGTTIGSSATSTSSCDCVPNVARIVRPHGTPPSRAFGVGGAPSADARKSTTRPFVDASRQRLCRLSSKSTSCGKACDPTASSETLCLDFLPSAFFRRRPRPTVAQTDSSIAH